MIKAHIPDEFLLDFFLKYLFSNATLSRFIIKEQVIFRAQQFHLVYSQYRVLYEIFPNALRA
jgi:hypothetical protein